MSAIEESGCFDGPLKLVTITLIHDSMLGRRLLRSTVQEFVHALLLFKPFCAPTFFSVFRKGD